MTYASLGADEFTAAFARYGRTLWLLAAAWVGRSEAEDLVQEAARVAWQQRARFTTGTDLRAWLAQIVRHTGANWRRRRGPTIEDPAQLVEPMARPDRSAPLEARAVGPFDADDHGLSDELAQALRSLSAVARACLLLHVVADLSYGEIGTMLDLPENTVASHVRRARLTLRGSLAAADVNALPQPDSP